MDKLSCQVTNLKLFPIFFLDGQSNWSLAGLAYGLKVCYNLDKLQGRKFVLRFRLFYNRIELNGNW